MMSQDGQSQNDDLGVTQELEIDRICVRFEEALRSGAQPSIEQFLDTVNEPSRPHLLRQLLLLELEHEKGLGNEADVAEYLKRFPTNRSIVFSAFAEHARPEGPAETEVRGPDPKRPVGAESDSSPSDSSHHGRFLPGTKLAGRYRIVSLLGKGGMGEVYRADDLKLGHAVALKFLPKELASDPMRLEYFYSEVRLSRQISHPNVCRVYDIAEADGQHFLSMEYVDGEDLKGLLRRVGRFPKDRGIEIARQLCAALAAAHDRGVLHRDLKPANVMIDGRGQVRITDFGLATVLDEGESGDSFVGTPAYMAPEQRQRAETSVQSDIYSLGLVMYEVFTGEPAHKTGSPAGVDTEQEGNSSPSDPSDLVEDMDPSVDRIIMRCLDRDPQGRPQSVAAVAAALPGGDPLAAALAAGETPSPELVAASGDSGRLSPTVAGACLAGRIAGWVVFAVLADRYSLFNRAPLKLPPAALKEDAKDIIRHLGYDEPPADEASGFETVAEDFEYIGQLSLPENARGRWSLLGTSPWSGIVFWYRESPEDFVANDFFNAGGVNRGRVSSWIPPWDRPGMLGVRLHPRKGELRWFRAVPPETAEELDSSQVVAEPRWAEWFSKTLVGFNLDDLKPARWRRTPPDAFDCWQAWEGSWPDSNEPLYVQAASYRGKPVYFEVFASKTPSRSRFRDIGLFVLALFAVLVGAVAMALRNLHLGRGDRRGAWRICSYVFLLHMVCWFVQANHCGGRYEYAVFSLGLAAACYSAVLMWVNYMAIEPLVRRVWPELLVSWVRLLDGQLSDPRVGRDLLIGTLCGTLAAAWALADWALGVAPPNAFTLDTLLGALALTGGVVGLHLLSIRFGMVYLVELLLVRLLVRHPIVAAGLVVIGMTAAVGQGIGILGPYGWLLLGLQITFFVTILLRFGLVTLMAMMFTFYVHTSTPFTADTFAFYFSNGLLGIVIVMAIALYGAFTSTGAKPIFGSAPPTRYR